MSAEKEFQKLVGSLDYPIYVVTAAAGEEKDGCVVGFATQCSIHPPLYIVCISNKNRTYEIASRAEVLGVHLIPEDRKDLAELFGGHTADEEDKLSRVGWTSGPDGVPLLDDLPSRFAGEIRRRFDYDGDHAAFVVEPVEARHDAAPPWLSFQRVKDIDPGHEA